MSKYSVKRPYTVIVGVILVIVLGVVSLTRMTADLLPNMSLPYVMVMTTYPGASPEEVESEITIPIEESMATTSNIKNVTSMSYDNYSMVVLEYEQSTNMDSIMIEISEDLDQISGNFADMVGSPIIMQIDPDMMPVMMAAVEMDGMDAVETTDYVNDEIIPSIKSVEGVASVSTIGAVTETVEVTLDQEKIDALNEKIQATIESQFSEAQSQINAGKSQLNSTKADISSGMNGATSQLAGSQANLTAGMNEQITQLNASKATVDATITKLTDLNTKAQSAQSRIAAADIVLASSASSADKATAQSDKDAAQSEIAAVNSEMAQYAPIVNQYAPDQEFDSYDDISAAVTVLTEASVQISTTISTLQTALNMMSSGEITSDQALQSLNGQDISNLLLASSEQQLAEAQEQIDSAKKSALTSADANTIFSIENVTGLLTAQNFSMPAGYVNEGDTKYLVRVGDKITSVADLNDLILVDMGMDGLEPITLGDVATVEKTNDSAESYSRVNGNPGIMLSIQKQTGYSTGSVTDALTEKLDNLKDTNEGFGSMILMDQGVYIDMIVNSVVENMIIGAILAILVLMIFLKDVRPTLVIACSIPLSVIFAIVLMYFTGITLNVISLSGLALGIGMLVDNSIVVIENIYRMRNEGVPIKKAAVEGAKQVTGAIIASTLTTVCVFAPIVFTEGMTRQIFVDMALTIAFSLLASLIVALTFVPMMSAGVIKSTAEKQHPWLDKVKDIYASVLEKLLHKKAFVFIAVITLLILSAWASFSRGMSFMPSMDGDQITVTVSTEDDTTTMEEISAIGDDVTARLSEIKDIEDIGIMNGGSNLMGGGDSDTTSLTCYVTLAEDTTKSNKEIEKEILAKTKDIDCEVTVSSAMMDMSMLTGTGVSIDISGPDLDELQKIAADVGDIVSDVKGTQNVDNGLSDVTPTFTVSVDKAKAAKYGMTTAQIFQLVSGEMSTASSATTLSEDGKSYDVTIAPGEEEDVTIDSLKAITFTYTNAAGEETEVPITDVAEFVQSESLSTINRDSQERTISVSAEVDEDHNVTLLSQQIEKKLADYETPDGYSIEIAGENEQIMDAMQQVMLMLILGVILIYLIMVAQFQSLLSPFIIMFTIPLAFTGGFIGLFVTGKDVSIIALIGFVMLAGIIVNNGIVLVDYINQLRREGMSKQEAIIEAGRTRLRPIMMTALTTILAMLLMALGVGKGSAMMQPMAIVTIGGLVYGTLLTLIVVPCIYDLFNKEKDMTEEEI